VTVGELRKLLKGHPKDREIMLSIDSEGNNFKHLDGAGAQYYWWPEVEELWDVEDRAGEEIPDNAYPVLILWPR